MDMVDLMRARDDQDAQAADARSSIATRFNRWAGDYELSALQDAYYGPVQAQALRMAREAAPAPRRLVDVGCGTGRLLRSAADWFCDTELIGVDVAEHMVRQARVLAPRSSHIAFVNAEVENLPLADDSIDVALCTACCHHWADPVAAFEEIARVLRPEGTLVAAHLLGLADWAVAAPAKLRRRRRAEIALLSAVLNRCGLTVTDSVVYNGCAVMPGTVIIRAGQLPRDRHRRFAVPDVGGYGS